MPRFGGCEYFDQFGNDCSGEGAAGNDCSELPPLCRIIAQYGNREPGNDEGNNDGDYRGNPTREVSGFSKFSYPRCR